MAETDRSVPQMQATGSRVIQSSVGLAEKMLSSAKTPSKTLTGARSDTDAIIGDLTRQLEGEKEKNRSLEDQYKFRIASFVRRETQTKNKIESLERRLNDGSDQDEHGQRMSYIENMHKSVMGGLECIQDNTAKILQDQEKDLMRAFRARLQEVSKDLEAQKSKKGEHSTELQARHRRVVAELHEAQELAQTFDKKNQQLDAENKKLLEKLRTREDDRQCLLRELVLSKKEAARLKAQLKDGLASTGNLTGTFGQTGGFSSEAALDRSDMSPSSSQRRPFTQKQIDQAKQQSTTNRSYEREVKYRDAVTRLKRMVEAERRKVRALQQQQTDVLQQRTELEVLLRQSLDDVKAEIMRHRLEHERKDGPTLPGPGQTIAQMSVHELSAQDRERVLELLLSQQRVVQLLYSKTFPQQPPSPLVIEDEVNGLTTNKPACKDDDFSWLSDIIPPEA